MKATLQLQMLVRLAFAIFCTPFITSCEKVNQLPEVPQTFTVNATPQTITYHMPSRIEASANLVGNIKIEQGGKIVLDTQRVNRVFFDTEKLKETTSYKITFVGAKETKVENITIMVTPVHPSLKLLFDGEWQFAGSSIKASSQKEYETQVISPCAYDDVTTFKSDKTLFVHQGLLLCSNEANAVAQYDYKIVADTIRLTRGTNNITVTNIDEKEMKFHMVLPDSNDPLNPARFIHHTQIYKNVAKK